jgi:hypothetical protein
MWSVGEEARYMLTRKQDLHGAYCNSSAPNGSHLITTEDDTEMERRGALKI